MPLGHQFFLPRFTVPAGSSLTDQKHWDYAFLTEAEFIEKHGEEALKEIRGTDHSEFVSRV